MLSQPGYVKKIILIIEADANQRRLYSAVFRQDGFTVIEATDGEEGLRRTREDRPDVLLLALALPKLRGLDVLAKIKGEKDTRDIPVVIFSLLGGELDMHRAEGLGAEAFLSKGKCSPRGLLEKVHEVLAAQNMKGTRTYGLFLTEGKGDLAKLRKDMSLPASGKCASCGKHMLLKLTPDPSRKNDQWFTARFVCTECGK
ncbi:response regulator [Candidatus Peregrinibacteria bacterium]|nr:response regulator [Candidatus Peregrinibacteria bacterium]